MKNLFTLGLALITTINLAVAQIKEGHVSYTMELTSTDPQAEMMKSMMQGAKMDLYFKENVSVSKMSMGMLGTTTTISDAKEKKALMLMDGMMGKIAVMSDIEDVEGKVETNEVPDNYTVTLTDETKTILGYTCKKVLLTIEEDVTSVMWITDDVSIYKGGQKFFGENISGFPLEFEMVYGGTTMKFTATAFDKTLKSAPKDLFDLSIPEGYKEMSPEEMMGMGM